MKMSFHKIGRSVACALFVAVLVNSQISPKPAAVRNECPAKSIESRLEDIEGRLEGLEKTVSTLNSPLIKGRCSCWEEIRRTKDLWLCDSLIRQLLFSL